MRSLGFGVLGPLLMSANGVRVPLGAPKQRAVLAMLLITRNRTVSVHSLINGVWDDNPVPAARTSIQSYVSTLRRLLRSGGGAALLSTHPHAWITTPWGVARVAVDGLQHGNGGAVQLGAQAGDDGGLGLTGLGLHGLVGAAFRADPAAAGR